VTNIWSLMQFIHNEPLQVVTICEYIICFCKSIALPRAFGSLRSSALQALVLGMKSRVLKSASVSYEFLILYLTSVLQVLTVAR
jgi:hypothetical protein